MLLNGQTHIDAITPMPATLMDAASTVTPVSGETITWFYSNSGIWASATGQAANTIVWGKTAYNKITNTAKTAIGGNNDTSVSFGAATRAAQRVNVPVSVFTSMLRLSPADQITAITKYLTTTGDYAVDHVAGQVWLKSKATVANDSISYSYRTAIITTTGSVSTTTHTTTHSDVGDSATSVTLLAANSARTGAEIRNDSTAVLYIEEGVTATTSSVNRVVQNAVYHPNPLSGDEIYRGIITGIWESDAGGFARISESV